MTITTDVRINYPINAKGLLDHVTRFAGGDPATAVRTEWRVGDPDWGDRIHSTNGIRNHAGQGFITLADVNWSECGLPSDPEWPSPPAVVCLSIDNPYGYGPPENTGHWLQAYEILPAVVAFLDQAGVPRTEWHWEDESNGTWHPGTTPVTALYDETIVRETWSVT